LALTANRIRRRTVHLQMVQSTSVVNTVITVLQYAILNFQPVNAGSYTCLITDQWGDTARTTPSYRACNHDAPCRAEWAHDTIHIAVSEGSVDSINLADSCMVSKAINSWPTRSRTDSTIADSLHGSVWKYAPIFTDSGSYTIRIQASTATDSARLPWCCML